MNEGSWTTFTLRQNVFCYIYEIYVKLNASNKYNNSSPYSSDSNVNANYFTINILEYKCLRKMVLLSIHSYIFNCTFLLSDEGKCSIIW